MLDLKHQADFLDDEVLCNDFEKNQDLFKGEGGVTKYFPRADSQFEDFSLSIALNRFLVDKDSLAEMRSMGEALTKRKLRKWVLARKKLELSRLDLHVLLRVLLRTNDSENELVQLHNLLSLVGNREVQLKALKDQDSKVESFINWP